MVNTEPKPLLDRLADKLLIGDGCWLWVGKRGRDGYGHIKWDRRDQRVHRVVYELLVEPIGAGLTLDHLCGEKACARPAHLEPVTLRENLRRRGRTSGTEVRAAQLRSRTHCKNGHEFTPESTRRDAKGARVCRTCHREAAARARR